MKTIKNQTFPSERDLYGQENLKLINCRFEGEEDGESALKECSNIFLEDCFMDLRYPLWHDSHVVLKNITQTPNCRAALWYSNDIEISSSHLNGIKVIRECQNIKIADTDIVSPEFGWKSSGFEIENTSITSEYVLFLAKNLKIKNSTFNGKYGFQYIENAELDQCKLKTKDAFWHGKNITISNSVVEGEYLGWYSENLTFINCTIIGIQPLCYCKNLKLINCRLVNTNLCFEYSEVEAEIIGTVDSIKNPYKGSIIADKINEIIITNDSKMPSLAKIEQRKSL